MRIFILLLLAYATHATEDGEHCAADGACSGDALLQHKSMSSKMEVDLDEESDYEMDEEGGPMNLEEEEEDTDADGHNNYLVCEGKVDEELLACMDEVDAKSTPPEQEEKPMGAHEQDHTLHSHDGTPEDVAIMGPAREIFGIDGVEGSQNQCFVKNQQMNAMQTPDSVEKTFNNDNTANGGTDRGDWAKCLPPPMYTVMSLNGFEEGEIKDKEFSKSMKGATDLYSLLKFAHNEACAHVVLDVSEKALAKKIANEINHIEPPSMGPKILEAVKTAVGVVVKQYRSTGPDNPGNQAAMAAIEQAVASGNGRNVQNVLNRQIRNSGLVTGRDVGGTAVRNLWRQMYDQSRQNNGAAMTNTLNQIKAWWAARPDPADFLADTKRKQGNNAANGADGIPDTVQNFAYCGQRGRNVRDQNNNVNTQAKQFTQVKVQLGLDPKSGDVMIMGRGGWTSQKDTVAQTKAQPMSALLPAGAVQFPEGKQTYQDQMFAQGNVACGQRADGAWTMTTQDRNNNNQNTARPTQEEGYFCIWVLNDMQNLPADQRGGFSNTEFVAESAEAMATVLGGKPEYYTGFFSKDSEQYRYFHCHYAPQNSGALRVYSFQHQAERNYPGSVRQVCSCDWRKMGMLVSRCDCTLDAQANGGCRRVEMQALNEGTQVDLWINKGAPSTVALSHGDLAEGRIMSYDYQNDNQPDAEQIFQEATGRVRQTTNGNGGNNVVCATDQNGVPNNGNVRTFQRNTPATAAGKQVFADFNNDGQLQTNGNNGGDTRNREFRLQDITAKQNGNQVSVPAGGDNIEFEAPTGEACDALKMTKDCKPADAGKRTGAALTEFLGKFCQTSASLYAVPLRMRNDGKAQSVAQGFTNQQGYLPGLDYPAGNFRQAGRSYPNGQALFPKAPGAARTATSALDKMFLDADANKDGRITKLEFGGFATANKMLKPALLQVEMDMDVLDLNRDGNLTLTELKMLHYGGPSLLQQPMTKGAKNLNTPNQREYKMTEQPLGVGGTTMYTYFSVAARNDAHIGLFQRRVGYAEVQKNQYYEIVLGGRGNSRSYLRRDRGTRAQANTPNILSTTEQRDFWVSADCETGRVALGRGKSFNEEIIMEWTDTVPYCPKSMAVHTGYGATGAWSFGDVPNPDAALSARKAITLEARGAWSNMDAAQGQIVSGGNNARNADGAPAMAVNNAIGGNAAGAPSAVPASFTTPGQKDFGVVENSFANKGVFGAASKSKGAKYMTALIKEETGRANGITCLNGKFVWAKLKEDGTRPVVSTVREALNARGPNQANGQWACRYLGTHCNTNNCNNNANTEVADTYIDSNGEATLEKGKKVQTLVPGAAAAAAGNAGNGNAAQDDNRRRRRRRRRR